MSKVIFLDIDGVLNRDVTMDRTPQGFIGVEDCLVDNLAEIVRETGADIVLSSDWKNYWQTEYDKCGPEGQYLVDKLAKKHLKIKDKTVDASRGRDGFSGRGRGINAYLGQHPEVTNYLVLDDVRFMDFDEDILRHFIHTQERDGLIPTDVLLSIRILNS